MTTATRPASESTIAAPGWRTSPEAAGSLAIVCGSCVYISTNRDPFKEPPRLTSHPVRGDGESFAQVAAWGLASGVENVWILPPGRLAKDFRQLASVSKMQAEAGNDYYIHNLTTRGPEANSKLVGVVAQRATDGTEATGYGALCTIWGPSALGVWNLDALPTNVGPDVRANDLAYAWWLASYALRTRLRFSPSYSGLTLLRKLLNKSKKDFPQPSARYADLIRAAQARPLGFIQPAREVAPDEPPVRVWSYDRNWSYVSSARVVPLGDPTPVGAFVEGRPGFYRVSVTPPERWRATQPDPFQRGGYDRIWAWEPQMRLALLSGWTIDTIHEGYAWVGPNSTYDMRPWNERMWLARHTLAAMADIRGVPAIAARGIVKQVGVAAIGRLKSSKGHMLIEEDEAEQDDITRLEIAEDGRLSGLVEVQTALGRSDLYRPEWWSTIIANASERALSMAYTHCPLDGMGGWVDAIYAPSPRGLEGDGNKPGGWHLEYRGVEIPASVAYGGNLRAFTSAVARAARNG